MMVATPTAMTATAAAVRERRGMRGNYTVMMQQDGSRTGMQRTAT
jgi:hypothetical protein